MISNKCGKFEITTSGPHPHSHSLSLGGNAFPYVLKGDEIYELFYVVNEAVRSYESIKAMDLNFTVDCSATLTKADKNEQ